MIYQDLNLDFKVPAHTCDFDEDVNRWSLCVWPDLCDGDYIFGAQTNWTFAFGTNATFNLPLSTLLIDY